MCIRDSSITCLIVGFVISRISPFAKLNHVIFVAVAVFITFLQNTLGSPHEFLWKFIAMMGVFPIAILLGAKISGATAQSPVEENLDEE